MKLAREDRETYTSNIPVVPVLVGELQTRSQYLNQRLQNIFLLHKCSLGVQERLAHMIQNLSQLNRN